MKCILTSSSFFVYLRSPMNKLLVLLTLAFLCSISGFAQKAETKAMVTTIDSKADSTALNLAKDAFAAHGGAKFKNVKTMVMRGSVDMTSSAFNQAIPSA